MFFQKIPNFGPKIPTSTTRNLLFRKFAAVYGKCNSFPPILLTHDAPLFVKPPIRPSQYIQLYTSPIRNHYYAHRPKLLLSDTGEILREGGVQTIFRPMPVAMATTKSANRKTFGKHSQTYSMDSMAIRIRKRI